VGLTRDEIVSFHWMPSHEKDFITRSLLQGKLDEAERLRAEIRGAGDNLDVASLQELLRSADSTLDDLRLAGNLVILAFLSGRSQRERHARRDQLAQQVWGWQQGGGSSTLRQLVDELRSDLHVTPFHWQIDFPEVFDRQDPGFDALVGNPPFLGGMRISTVLTRQYLEWLYQLAPGAGSRADFVVYFFRRSFALTREAGCFGLLATNTIAQGDTRLGGLYPIVREGGKIVAATRRIPWPGSVAVIVSAVHVCKRDYGPRVLDGAQVSRITFCSQREAMMSRSS
jgi:hypothetical protein